MPGGLGSPRRRHPSQGRPPRPMPSSLSAGNHGLSLSSGCTDRSDAAVVNHRWPTGPFEVVIQELEITLRSSSNCRCSSSRPVSEPDRVYESGHMRCSGTEKLLGVRDPLLDVD